jgi:hypothetical protein
MPHCTDREQTGNDAKDRQTPSPFLQLIIAESFQGKSNEKYDANEKRENGENVHSPENSKPKIECRAVGVHHVHHKN